MGKVNWLTYAIALYLGAIVFYAFKDSQDGFWAVYHNWVGTYLVLTLIAGGIKKNKNKLDITLLIATGIVKIFTAIAFQMWYNTDFKTHPYNDDPNIFCIIVVVIFSVTILVSYLKHKADERDRI